MYPLGSVLIVENLRNSKSVRVLVTDRIGKRFSRARIDLSVLAFSKIADVNIGLITVSIRKD
jgi:rare lipoprotein A (peptidoglycan hydrolase)